MKILIEEEWSVSSDCEPDIGNLIWLIGTVSMILGIIIYFAS